MKFYSDLNLLHIDKLPQNVYDLNSAYFYVSLLPKELKYKFISKLNPEAVKAYSSILTIDDEFVSSEDECDCIVFPPCSPYMGFTEYMDNHAHILSKTNKPVVVIYFSADDRVFDVGSAIQLYRGGSFRSLNHNNVHGSLYVVADYYRGIMAPTTLNVSYCGFPGNDPTRQYVVDKFLQYDYFNCIGRTMWGGNSERDGLERDSYTIGPSDKNKREFIENMEASLYSLVVRGTANASYRFIESFMMGRIPVFIDTDCMLPFDDIIPYKTNMVWLKPDDDDYDKVISEFHNSHTEEELIKLQLENRTIWEKYFRADNAYYNMKHMLESNL